MIYEYECEACEHQFEAEQKITDPKIEECPECGKLKVKRLISGGTSFQLKGGCWAKDLYSGNK